jgi:hypothetical protein
MKIVIFVVIFFCIGAFFIISNYNLHLNKQEERSSFTSLYFSWLGNFFSQTAHITGAVVHSEWLPTANETLQNTNNKNSDVDVINFIQR